MLSGTLGYNVSRTTLQTFVQRIPVPVVSLGLGLPGIPSVTVDDRVGMNQLMQHLLTDTNDGHYVFIRGYANDPYSNQRESIYRHALDEHDICVSRLHTIDGNYDQIAVYKQVRELVQIQPTIRTIVAANDLMASSAARAVQALGLDIPNDIAISGFDDTFDSVATYPPITTVRQPLGRMASISVAMLLDLLSGTWAVKQSSVDSRLIIRGSTRTVGADTQEIDTQDGLLDKISQSLYGLNKPKDVNIKKLTNAFLKVKDDNGLELRTLCRMLLAHQASDEQLHWWLCLLDQLENSSCQRVKQEGSSGAEQAQLFLQLRQLLWGQSMGHELDINRLQIVQADFQLEISSANEPKDISTALQRWARSSGVKRGYLIRYINASDQPQPLAELLWSYPDVKPVTSTINFQSSQLLPVTFQAALQRDTLIMLPVSARTQLFGYLLVDPAGVSLDRIHNTAVSIGNALHSMSLVDELESQASALKSANAELSSMARTDYLTGLPNRYRFAEAIEDALSHCYTHHEEGALLYVDLDGFKPVNDALGHDAGDKLLVDVAQLLISSVGELLTQQSMAYRIGGDEFALLCYPLPEGVDLRAISQKLLERLQLRMLIGGKVHSVTASIGVALLPHDAADSDSLVRAADQAMYLAKHGGKNQVIFAADEQQSDAA